MLSAWIPARAAGPDIFPLSDVKPGLKGYGLTVVSGSAIDRFDVEVLGLLPNASPGRTSIVVKVAGLGLEDSGIVAGMSGSPVYFDGKLAGAIAAGWGFTKQPIGLVTPIESMLTIDAPSVVPAGTVAGGTSLAAASASFLEAATASEGERIAALEAGFRRFGPRDGGAVNALAATASGIPTASLARWQDALARLSLRDVAVAAAGSDPAAAPPGPLSGGSSISALLVDGDLRLAATGTVTSVSPDGRFLAFGHPFLNFGELELPVAPASVVTVVPNFFQSFKIGVPGKAVYRLTKDRDTGVAGRTDHVALLLPVRFEFKTPGAPIRKMTWSVSPQPRLLPILLALTTDGALNLLDPTPRERTLAFRVSIETAAGPITYEDEATGARARDVATLTTATLAGIIADNDFEDPKLSGVSITVSSEAGERRMRIVDADLVSRRVAPGEDVVATVRLEDRRGRVTTRALRLRVPPECPEGKAVFLVADGSTTSAMHVLLNPVEPRSLSDFGAWVARLVPGNRLVTSLLVPSRGAATGRATLSALPPTAATLLARGADSSPEPGRGDVAQRIVAEAETTLDRPLTGSIRLELDVERPRTR